jgi:hypothetical protein
VVFGYRFHLRSYGPWDWIPLEHWLVVLKKYSQSVGDDVTEIVQTHVKNRMWNYVRKQNTGTKLTNVKFRIGQTFFPSQFYKRKPSGQVRTISQTFSRSQML